MSKGRVVRVDFGINESPITPKPNYVSIILWILVVITFNNVICLMPMKR